MRDRIELRHVTIRAPERDGVVTTAADVEDAFLTASLSPEIQRGVLWREAVFVPRNRVQHTDVSQGPIERQLGLASLTVYTAGMRHAEVQLEGVAMEDAVAMRDELVGEGADDDAV